MDDTRPVFVQIIEMIEDDILNGTYSEDDLIISTPQISKLLGVNPTTAQKAITVLTDHNIIYKKRGVGMAVQKGAREAILLQRRKTFFDTVVPSFVSQAEKIGISGDELLRIVEENIHD